MGCCSSCEGTGSSHDVETNGRCWDCYGTGHAHQGRCRRLWLTVSRSKTSPGGSHVQALGLKVGYWPCLRAPFVSLCVGSRIIDLWWGLPSYLDHDWQWCWPRR